MPKSFWDASAHAELAERAARLEPDAARRWGRMTCPQMVAHVRDAFRLYLGELSARPRKSPLHYWPFKQLIIYVMPMPRGAPTARELLPGACGEWDAQVRELHDVMERFARHATRKEWPLHQIFGRLSGRAVGVLAYKHTDHHFKQFGV